MANKIDMKSFHERYSLLIKKYPKTLEWVRHKASWEHIPLGTVLNEYRDHIEALMKEEGASDENA